MDIEGDGMMDFFVARMKDRQVGERNILKAGPNVSYKVSHLLRYFCMYVQRRGSLDKYGS